MTVLAIRSFIFFFKCVTCGHMNIEKRSPTKWTRSLKLEKSKYCFETLGEIRKIEFKGSQADKL